MRPVHTYFGALFRLGRHGYEELSPLGYEKTSLRARWGGIAGGPIIVVGVFLFEDFQQSLAGKHLDSPPSRVIEKIVCFPRDVL